MLLTSTRLFFIVSFALVEAYLNKIRITAPELASRYNVNKRALTPPLHRLVQAGILRSQVGGANPGFIFAKSPKEIAISDVTSILEGSIKFMECRQIMPDIQCELPSCDFCIINREMSTVVDKAKSALASFTLYDMYLNALKHTKLSEEQDQI